MPLNQACLNRTYGPSRYDVTAERVRAFASATLSAPLTSPGSGLDVALPTQSFLPCWPVIQEAITDPDLGNAPGQIIHGEQVMRFNRPVIAGDVLTTTGTVTRIEPKGRNEVYVLHLESRDSADEIVVEQDNICISLGSAGEPASTSPDAPARPSPQASPEEPRQPDWVSEEALPEDITRQYAEASGDFSEVHLDEEFARSLGFPGIIVHGMCLLSIAVRPVIQTQLGDDVSSVRGIRVRFASPVQPGETVRTEYFKDPSGFSFTTFAGDRKVLGAGLVEVGQR